MIFFLKIEYTLKQKDNKSFQIPMKFIFLTLLLIA